MATYTGSITLTNINDGADADSYHLSSNIEGFLKHYEYDLAGNEVIVFSDEVIEFLLEHNINDLFLPISPSSYYTSLSTLENGAFYSEYNYTTAEAWLVDYATVYIKVGSEYVLNTDSLYHSTWTYYVNLLNDINDLWNLFLHINVVDENNNNVTLYDKVYSIDVLNNSINFNLYNSVFYPVDESLNLVDGLPSNYIVALRSYRTFVELQNAYFILSAFLDNNLSELYDYKVFFVEYVVNLDFARFALTATNILASVDNSALIFDGTGLTIYDGGLTIKQSEQYALTEDSTPELGKAYFVYENKLYILYTGNFSNGFALSLSRPDDWDEVYTSYYTYDSLQQKYIAVEPSDPIPTWLASTYYRPVYELTPEEDLLKYDIENKRLNIKGSGEFTGTIYATDGVFSGTIAALAGSIGGFDINNDALISKAKEIVEYIPWTYDESQWNKVKDSLYILDETNTYVPNTDPIYHSGVTYYTRVESGEPLIQLLGTEGRIIAKNINLGTGVVIDDYIKLGNSYIYNPLTHDNSFIDIKDVNDESIIEFRADGTGNIGAIHINGNTSRLNGINWWISPDKAEFSNIDVTGTIHTSVFETGRILSVGGSMIFKEGARVLSVTNTEEGLLLTLETKMGLKPGSIVLCTTNDSDYTDTTLINLLNFYGRVVSSIIEKEYIENTDPFYENVAYYTYDTQSGKYIRFTGDSFEDGVIYYILYEGNLLVIVELEPEAAGYENLISLIIQLGDNVYTETEDTSRYSEWEYNHSVTTPENWNSIYNDLYIKTNETYTLMSTKPNDWDLRYYTYYIEDNDNYILIGASESRVGYGIIGLAELSDSSVTAPEFESNTYYVRTSVFIKNEDSTYNALTVYYVNNKKDYYIYNVMTDSFSLYTGNELVLGVSYFEKTSEYTNNLIIGVNATDHINKMLYPEGFTFIKFDNLDNENINPTYNDTPILFLGNLEGLNNENISGYGLYGENVFLTGSLTTRSGLDSNAKYAGVNTLSGVIATAFTEEFFPYVPWTYNDNDWPDIYNTLFIYDQSTHEYILNTNYEYNSDITYYTGGPDTSKIVFWAGSEDTKPEHILAAPFLVTENGSFYANRGLFEGSIFVRATIEASELRTASIFGVGDNPALKIYDTNVNKGGIHFYELDNGASVETLRITNRGLSATQGLDYFIEIERSVNTVINFNGLLITADTFITKDNDNAHLELNGTEFTVYLKNQEGVNSIYNFITFDGNNLSYEIKYDDNNRILLDLKNGELNLISSSTKVSNNFSLGGKIDYKLVIEEIEESGIITSNPIGYDLFVR